MNGQGVGLPTLRIADGPWRCVEPEAGGPVFVCPSCWPLVAAYWEEREDATVRTLAERPEWARCGLCEPEYEC